MKLDNLLDSLKDHKAVMREEYSYYVFPISDGIPSLRPEVLEDVVEAIVRIADIDVDLIVTAEAMGIPVATALSLKTGIPTTIVRKREYGLDGETAVDQVTGYSSSRMFINGVKPGMKVLVVDDIISTGGTLVVILKALGRMGAVVADAVSVLDKGEGCLRVKRETGIEVKCLVRIVEAGGELEFVPLV